MKRAKTKAFPKRRFTRLTPAERSELDRARQISTAGPFEGLRAYFRARLADMPTEDARRDTSMPDSN